MRPTLRPTILVIDDDQQLRETLVALLRAEGFVVHGASDGGSALTTLTESDPDLIVVDLLMPGMHGQAFLREIRQRRGKYIPVIMMTALRGWAQRDASGADAFLEKPFDIDTLLGAIELTLYRHGTAAPL